MDGTLPDPEVAKNDATLSESSGASSTQSTTLPRGATVGRYVVLDWLGAGGMGAVYSAYDFGLDRRIGLKFVSRRTPRWDDRQARLVREGQALARLSHPNVIAVHDVGEYNGQVFIAVELVAGVTLAQWLAPRRPWREVLAVFLQAGKGLAAAHLAGLVHRDFKPENVLVGEDGRVRVTDFGLAISLDAEASDRAGTSRYMAPEQRRRQPLDARADQFSFCVSLFEALYGVHPYGDRLDQIAALQPSLRDVRRAVPRAIDDAVRRGLAQRPDDRHASMTELLASLTRRQRAVVPGWFPTAAVATAAASAWALAVLANPATAPSAPSHETASISQCVAAPLDRSFVSGLATPREVSSRVPTPAAGSVAAFAAEESRVTAERADGFSSPIELRVTSTEKPGVLPNPSKHSDPSRSLFDRLVDSIARVARLLDEGAPSTAPGLAQLGQNLSSWSLPRPPETSGALGGLQALSGLTAHANPLADAAPSSEQTLEQKLRLQLASAQTPAAYAEVQFQLAQVLWNEPGQRAQALQLAQQALKTLSSDASNTPLAHDVDIWLHTRATVPELPTHVPD